MSDENKGQKIAKHINRTNATWIGLIAIVPNLSENVIPVLQALLNLLSAATGAPTGGA